MSLKNLLPGEERVVEIPDVTTSTKRLTIVSDRILPSQEIEFEVSRLQMTLQVLSQLRIQVV